MTKSIGERLVEVLGGIAPLYLSEASSDSYPYIVYDQTVSPICDKSTTAVGFESEMTLMVYDKDFKKADALATQAKVLLAAQMDGLDGLLAIPQSERKECNEGVWRIELVYKIILLG